MAIEVISTIKPKNNGNFPLIEAKDISVDENGTRLDEKLSNLAGTTPTFDLATMGLPDVSLDGAEAYLATDTTAIMTALENGAVRFLLNVSFGENVLSMSVIPNPVSSMGAWVCTAIIAYGDIKLIGTIAIQEGAVVVWFSSLNEGEAVATSIDLSAFESNGQIAETYADGTTKTTTVEFDASGNPTKITDGDGNVTTLTW